MSAPLVDAPINYERNCEQKRVHVYRGQRREKVFDARRKALPNFLQEKQIIQIHIVSLSSFWAALFDFVFKARRAAYYHHVFFFVCFVEQSRHQVSVLRNCFFADGTNALDSGLAKRIAVWAAGDYAALVRNVHRPKNFAEHILAVKQWRAAHRAVDGSALGFLRLRLLSVFFAEGKVRKRDYEDDDS